MADVIFVTQRPIWFPNVPSGQGALASTVLQDVNQAIDVSAYDEIDVVANIYKISGGTSLYLNILGNHQKSQDDGTWQGGKNALGTINLGTVGEGNVGTTSITLVNTRYARWQLAPTGTYALALDLIYYCRRKGS